MTGKNVGDPYRDSKIQKTHTTFDHHVYEVVFSSDNGIPETTKENIMARNVIHLMSILEIDGTYPKGHRVKSINEIAYVPTCYMLLSVGRINKDFSINGKDDA